MTQPQMEQTAEMTAIILQQNQQMMQLGEYVQQLSGLVPVLLGLEARIKALEKQSAQITLQHQDVQALNKRIRQRAGVLCERYRLYRPNDQSAMAAAIRKHILKTNNIKNLHDLPAKALPDTEKAIEGFAGFEAAQKIREREQ